jgi:tetratricopeptide (TPR) repeat protein
VGAKLAGTWDAARQSFADQFEQDTSGFVYRRSQKGEAIRVSVEERQKFIDAFNRNLSRSSLILSASLVLIVGGVVLCGIVTGWHVPDAAFVVAGVGAMIPYLAYYRWAWGAPSRALEGRTPIARERSRDEVRQLTFQRMTYGNLAAAAGGGLAVPLIASGRHDLLSGWGRLWLVFGAALILFAGVQAFRKWRFEQDNPALPPLQATSAPVIAGLAVQADDEPDGADSKRSLWRYAPLALILLGIGFIAYTAAGKRLAQEPIFWPSLMALFGAWALFTVLQGFRTGKVTPWVRGSWDSYDRETHPKSYWASMAWNAVLGGGVFWFALVGLRDVPSQTVQNHCANEHDQFTVKASFDACTQLIVGKARATYLSAGDAYDYRGYDDERLNNRELAIADYTQAIRLEPKDEYAYFHRGVIFLNTRRLDNAVADLSRAHELDPKDAWSLANRGLAYALMKDTPRAEADFRVVEASDKSNPVMLRGRAVLSINALNMADAVSYLTASLKSDPDNVWTVRTRAWAYRQLGDDEHADADIKTYERLSGRPAFFNVPR